MLTNEKNPEIANLLFNKISQMMNKKGEYNFKVNQLDAHNFSRMQNFTYQRAKSNHLD